MANRRKLLARLIKPKTLSDIQLANLSVRPFRLAFLLDINSPGDVLLKYIRYNTSIWGGVFNFFAPLDSSNLSSHWWMALKQYDPDIVVYCSEPSEELENRIKEEIQPFETQKWSDDIALHHDIGSDRLGSIPIRFILSNLYKQLRPIEHSHFRIPECDPTSPYYPCSVSQDSARYIL